MKENLTESPHLLREDGWNFTEDGLGASHRPKKIIKYSIIWQGCDGFTRYRGALWWQC